MRVKRETNPWRSQFARTATIIDRFLELNPDFPKDRNPEDALRLYTSCVPFHLRADLRTHVEVRTDAWEHVKNHEPCERKFYAKEFV
jgi:hypothetical protein